MTRSAVGRFRRTVSPLTGAICCVSLVLGLAPATAGATASGAGVAGVGAGGWVQTSDQKQREVEAILDELDRLEEQMDQLAEDYAEALNDGIELDKEIAATEVRIKAKGIELVAMQAQLQNVALKTFVGKSVSSSLASILSSTGTLSDAVRRSYLTSVALNTGVSGLDELQGIIDDIARERKQLESQRTRKGGIADYAKKRLAAAQASANVYIERQAKALRDLGDLLRNEQSRRAKAALEDATRQAKEFTKTKYSNIPAPSTTAGVAVKAALSQIGVTYKFGALSPGVAFDCSGLMVYAWAKAGVSIPRSSRSQYGALTRIPTGAAQPGDLIFTRNPVGHVGMYLGNGQMIAAPRTGDVVKVYAVSWSKVTGVGRPK
ncbi:MAG: NlpC/P60 family protein [Actinomycetota bacterium]|jgi:peptidoglycan DL-endopeptidase CwlO|nr:NlpC/P60 family protein [Actinomycetota bacterium]